MIYNTIQNTPKTIRRKEFWSRSPIIYLIVTKQDCSIERTIESLLPDSLWINPNQLLLISVSILGKS